MTQFLDAALYYAGIGWYIFPCCPGQKVPACKHGCKDATTDEQQIRSWWNEWPTANIGLACGKQSGIYAIDIDIKEDINGFNSLAEFNSLPSTVRQDTPRGGAHCLFTASIPPANRNSFRPGIDIRGDGYYIVLAPSTHPNGGTYKWSRGYAPWEIKPAEFPEFMRPATRVPWNVNVPKRTQLSTSTDVLERARAYLAQVDPAIQGSNGHSRLLWAAVSLVRGFLLSDEQTYALLASEYNCRCVPPWDLNDKKDYKDFTRKISEARKLTPEHPPGWLLEERNYNCTVDTSRLLQTQLTNNTTQSPEREYQYLVHPPGLLGKICQWLNSTAIKEQPLLSLACALAFLGALFGRKVKDDLGSRTNLYCMGVAPSSAGKAHAMNQMRRLANSSGCTSLLGGDDIASDSAIEDRVYREPATLFMWDEIGHLLSHIKSGISQHHAQVVSLLMKLYSAAGNIYLGKEYAEQQRQRLIIQPCCCIYGTSTMERFTSGISPIELQDGWLSRCLVFVAPNDAPKKRGRVEAPVPKELSDIISAWASRVIAPDGPLSLTQFVGQHYNAQSPTQIIIPTEKEAEKRFINLDNEATKYGSNHPTLACLWAKAEENARRIALIVACGESFDHPTITGPIANYACRLMAYILTDFNMTIAPEIVTGTTDSQKRKLFNIVDKFGTTGCSKRDITRASQYLNRKQRGDLLDDLCEAGELAFSETKHGRVKTYLYWTATHYVNYLEQCNKKK